MKIYKFITFINILVFLIPFVFDLVFNSNLTLLTIVTGSLKGFRTGNFHPLQLLSAPFLHAGFLHLFVNMYALAYSIGPDVNKIFKNKNFLIIYVISALTASLASATFLNNPAGSVGASGAIMGLVGALAAFAIRAEIWNLFGSISAIVILNFYLGFSIPNIDNWGHFGGLVGGFIVGYFLLTPMVKNPEVVHYTPEELEVDQEKAVEA